MLCPMTNVQILGKKIDPHSPNVVRCFLFQFLRCLNYDLHIGILVGFKQCKIDMRQNFKNSHLSKVEA